jgi:hypothetical protein
MARKSAIYRRLEAQWAAGRPAVLDGATGSELQAMGYPEPDAVRRGLNFTWGSMALYEREDLTTELHRRYAEAGAQILETNTFFFHRLWRMEVDGDLDTPPGTWKERARRAVQLAREGGRLSGNPEVGVAFAMMITDSPKTEWAYNGPTARRTRPKFEREWVPVEHLRELGEVLRDEPPETLLVELAPDIPADLHFPYYEALLRSDIPLWISFRRGAGGRKSMILGVVMNGCPPASVSVHG